MNNILLTYSAGFLARNEGLLVRASFADRDVAVDALRKLLDRWGLVVDVSHPYIKERVMTGGYPLVVVESSFFVSITDGDRSDILVWGLTPQFLDTEVQEDTVRRLHDFPQGGVQQQTISDDLWASLKLNDEPCRLVDRLLAGYPAIERQDLPDNGDEI